MPPVKGRCFVIIAGKKQVKIICFLVRCAFCVDEWVSPKCDIETKIVQNFHHFEWIWHCISVELGLTIA